MQTYQIGHDGFFWWIGVIKSLDDALKVGRAKVRILGVHTSELGTNDLPWAVPIAPVTHATCLPSYVPGDWVLGFFLDGDMAQQPIILGVFPAIPQGEAGANAALSLASTLTKTYVTPTGI
jgi:hypothetical protein